MPSDVLITPASSKIDFTDGANATKTLKITGTSLNIDTSFAIGATTANNTLSVLGSASIGSAFNVAAPTNGLIVQGDVGVGTSSFVYSAANRGLLEIYGSAESLIALKHATGNLYIQKTSVDTYINNSGAGFISIATNNSERWRITSAGVLQSNGAQTLQTSTGNLTLASAAGNGHVLLSPNGTGNVGIGTATPSQKLEVQGNIKLGADNAGSYIYYVKDTEGAIINTSRSDLTQAGLFRSDGWGNFTVDKSIGIGYSLGSSFASSTIGNGNLYVLNSIGINTTSPLTKLDVRSGSITSGTATSTSGSTIIAGYYTSGALTVLGTEQSSGGPVLGYAVTPSTSATGAFLSSTTIAIPRSAYTQDGGTHRWYIGASQTVAIGGAVTTSEVMRINSSGNLGIATSTVSYKLHVQGDIYARSAVINVNGDLNTLRGNVTTMGYNLTNSPSGAGWITVYTSQNFSGGGDILSQLAYDNYNQQKLFTRYSADFGATWSAWKTIINSDAVSGTTNYVAKFTGTNTLGNSVLYDNGANIGIGINNPSASLHIKPASLGANGFILERYASTAKLVYMYESAADGYIEVRSGADVIVSKISGYASTPTYFQSNVGIGTTNPAAILTVQSNGAQLRLQTLSGPASYFSNIGSRYDSSHPFTIEVANGAATATEYFGIYADGGGANNRIALLNGNVGIGSNAPANKLHVNGSASIGSNYNTAAPTNGLIVEGSVGIGNTNPTGKLQVTGDIRTLQNGSDSVGSQLYIANAANNRAYNFQLNSAGTNLALWGYNSSNAWQNLVNFNYNGNVGIGIIAPSATLHLNSTTSGATLLRADGTNGTLFSVVDDLSDSLMSVNNSAGLPVLEVFADDRVVAGQYGANDFVLVNNKLGLGTNNPVAKLSVYTTSPHASPTGISVAAGAGGANLLARDSGNYHNWLPYTDGLNYYSADGHVFRSSNHLTNYVNINSNGNVGIGTVSPAAKLESYFSSNALTFNYLATNLNGNNPVPIYAFDVTSGAETRSIKAGFGYERHLPNGRGTLHIYNRSSDDTTNITGLRSSAGDIKISIDNSGNVGVGITVPTAKLHVVGPSILANNSAINPDSYLGSVVAGNIADGSGWGVTGGIAGNGNANGRTWAMGSSGNFFYMGFQNGSTGGSLQTFLQVSGPNRDLYLVPTSGSVGIGTTAPVTRLQIGSGTTTGATLGIQFGDDTGTRLYRSASGIVTCSGTIAATFSGNLTGNATNVTGTVALANGGSGQTSAQAAMNAFAGAVTSGSYLRGNGTNVVMSAIQAADVPTLNQNTTGNAATASLATTSDRLTTRDNRTISPSEDDAYRLRFGFTSWANNDSSPYADYLHLRSYSDSSGGNDNLVMFRKDAIGMRIYQAGFGTSVAYSSFKDVAFTDQSFFIGTTSVAINRASAALTLSGVNISGTAASETLGTVTGRGASTGTQISVATSAAGSMYTGTKAGTSYGDGISGATFKSITDNPNGGSYAFAAYFNGVSGTNSFYVGADGSGYFRSTLTTSVIKGDSGSDYPHSFTNADSGSTHWTNRSGRLLTSNGAGWQTDGRDPIMALVTSGNTNNTNIANSIGLALHNESQTNNTFSPAIAFSNLSNSGSYNTTYAAIIGRKTGQGVDSNWSAGELHFYTMPVGAYVNNIPSLIINSAANIGIGTTNPVTLLQVGTGTPTASGSGIQFGDDTTARLYRSSSGVVSVSNSFAAASGYVYASNYLQTGNNLIYPSSQSATQRLEVGNAANNAWIDGLTIAPGGNVVVAGTLTESSSIRYKENIETIIAPILPKLNEIRPVTYNKKDNPNNIEYGIIAEELNDLFPELVNKNNNGEVESVNYSRLTVLLIKAVKELKQEIEILKNK